MLVPFLAALAFAAAQPAPAQPAPPPAAAAPALSAAAQQALAGWKAEFARARADQAALPPPAGVVEELARRVALEQAGRRAMTPIMVSDLPAPEKRAVLAEAWRELTPVDEDNTRWLKTVLPADGWFRHGREGKEAARNAWLIVQHSSDREFQKEVLKRMEVLVTRDEVAGPDYALLYDRLEMFEGRPQRYGSQASCQDGTLQIYRLEDPARVDELRRRVGLRTTLEEYKAMMRVGSSC